MIENISRLSYQDYIWIKEEESINQLSNKKKLWNGDLIRRLLLNMTVVNPK